MAPNDILEATHLHLRDHWYGMNPLAPFDVEADLERTPGEGMRGRVTYSLGYEEHLRSETRAVEVSEEETAEVLRRLARVRTRRGEYVPRFENTDDYPSLAVELETPAGTAVFFSESQGEHHAPWALRLDGVTYVVDSGTPGKVLKRLRRAVGAGRLWEMVDEVERSAHAREEY